VSEHPTNLTQQQHPLPDEQWPPPPLPLFSAPPDEPPGCPDPLARKGSPIQSASTTSALSLPASALCRRASVAPDDINIASAIECAVPCSALPPWPLSPTNRMCDIRPKAAHIQSLQTTTRTGPVSAIDDDPMIERAGGGYELLMALQ